MPARIFIDSNVLLYTHDARGPVKAAIAVSWVEALARHRAGIINLQVLNELAAVLIRKKWLATPEEVFAAIDDYTAFGETPVTNAEVEGARALCSRYRYSWWDCILLASALELGCTHFLSEDLQDGQVVTDSSTRRLTIVDPFVHSPEQILAS